MSFAPIRAGSSTFFIPRCCRLLLECWIAKYFTCYYYCCCWLQELRAMLTLLLLTEFENEKRCSLTIWNIFGYKSKFFCCNFSQCKQNCFLEKFKVRLGALERKMTIFCFHCHYNLQRIKISFKSSNFDSF